MHDKKAPHADAHAKKGQAEQIVLGIECTAHTFGIAILRGREVIANRNHTFTTEKGGMIPAKVAEHHETQYPLLLAQALAEAKPHGIALKDITLIAVSDAPGLGHTLRIGMAAAKSLALQLKIPLMGVNHCVAHLEVTNLATDAKDPVLLYCSGANTQVIAFDEGKYRVFGETLDVGVGNFLDTFARNLGLGFPGGPKIEQLALNTTNGERDQIITLPYTVKGMDVSFAGLETHLLRKIEAMRAGHSTDAEHTAPLRPEALAYSAQEHVFAMLVETAERAMAHIGKKELALGGGVACNARLQEMCRIMCEERGAKFFCPPKQFLVDNAAMIAWTGNVMFAGGAAPLDLPTATIKPYERTDDIDVTWR